MRLLLALAAGAAGYCYYLGLGARRRAKPREELNRWEGEGGNVPSVATPSPQPSAVPMQSQQPYYPAGDSGMRH